MHVYNAKLVHVVIICVRLLRKSAATREERELVAEQVDTLLKQLQMDKVRIGSL